MPHAAGHQFTPEQLQSFFGGLQGGAQRGQTPQEVAGFLAAQTPQAQFFGGIQNAIAGGQTPQDVQRFLGSFQPQQQQAPPTGLIGSEQALQGGLEGGVAVFEEAGRIGREDITQSTQSALAQLAQTQGLVDQRFDQGIGPIQQFIDPGAQAQQLQAALSGVGGQDAFNQALLNSPVQDFINERGELALTRNASALGGLGGGNVRRELVRFGQGSASQDLQRQIGNLAALSGQGLQAAGAAGGLRGQQAGITGQLGQTGAGFQVQGGVNLANIAAGTGQNIGNAVLDTSRLVSGGRTRAGEQIAGAIGGTTSNLANLINQQGAGLSDITGAGSGNLANILNTLGQQTGASQEQLAALLANITTGQAGQVAGLPGVGGLVQNPNTLGQVGALAGGIGTLLQNFPQQQQPPSPQPVAMVGTGQQFASVA